MNNKIGGNKMSTSDEKPERKKWLMIKKPRKNGITFLTRDAQQFMTSNNEEFLVKEEQNELHK